MPDSVKRGDAKTLRWDLGRDLTGVTQARVIISQSPTIDAAVDRNGTIDDPPSDGIVSLTLTIGDWATLEAGRWLVEIETQPGPLTHPDTGYETLTVFADLA